MEALIGIFLLVTLFMPWINHARITSLKNDLADLREQMRLLRGETFIAEHRIQPVEFPHSDIDQKIKPADRVYTNELGHEQDAAYRATITQRINPEKTLQSESPSGHYNFELNIGTKISVWVGAISLICAAFFLVKYSIEAGWLGPAMRVSIGTLFGASLVAAGQWTIKRIGIANYERIAQGLVGAGIVSLYVSLYAAVSLYDLLPPLIGFAAMTAVTIMAVVMSLRHGQPIAAFGLLGGLLTPALVGSPDPNAMALFTYLFLLFSGMLFILARKNWWVLAALALIGVFLWTGFWYIAAFAADDALVLVLFAIAICAAVLNITKPYVMDKNQSASAVLPIHGLNFIALAGSAATIIWLSFKIILSLFDWSMLGIISLGCMGLAYFRPAVYQRGLWVKLGADLALFCIWAPAVPLAQAAIVALGMGAIYVALPSLLMRRIPDPRFWSGMQFASSAALYIISYYRITLPAELAENGFWGLSALILAGLSIWQAKDIRSGYHADNIIRDHLIAIYALAATSFISLGLAIELPWSYVPLAFAAQTTATMWVYSRTDIEFLKKITLLLAGAFIVMNFQQIGLFGGLIMSSLSGEIPSGYQVRDAILDAPLIRLGLPAVFMGFTLRLHGQQENPDNQLSHVLLGTALALALGAAYYLVRDVFQTRTDFFLIRAGFFERGIITLIIAGSAFSLLKYAEKSGTDFMKIWGMGLFHLAILRLGWFDLLLYNPYADKNQFVGNWPLINGVTLIYGAGILLSVWAAHSSYWGKNKLIRNSYKIFGFSFLFALVSLTVRQYFHGGWPADGVMSSAEFYSYSIVWLITGLWLLTFGITRKNKTTRIASLAFMLVTVGKVFLLDVGELDGLYRVFSFLGLGLSLIGLSYFYTRFIIRNET